MPPFHSSVFANSGLNMPQNSGPGMVPTSNAAVVTPEGLEIAGRWIESMLTADAQFPSLAEKLRTGIIPYKMLQRKANSLRKPYTAMWSNN